VRTAASLVSTGTERMVVEFAAKSLLGKARARPDLMRQVLEKAQREGVLTTVEAAFNRLDQPMPLGYSSAGTVVALGEELRGFNVGARVACAGGGYAVHAEYALVPQHLLAPLPEDVAFESAAFATLGAIALHGFRLSEAGLGDRVAVIGLGLLGLLSAGLASAAGCQVLGVDLDPERLRLGRAMGAETALRAEAAAAAEAFSNGQGCDAILICADTPSADPLELAGTIARDRGRVIVVGAVGMEVPRKTYFAKELTLLVSRSYGPGRYDPAYEEAGQDYPIGYVRWTEGRNLGAFVNLLGRGRLDVGPLITHRFPIAEAPKAYELITAEISEPYLGVVLTYPEPAPPATTTNHQGAGGWQPPVEGVVRLGVLGAGNFAQATLLPILQRLPDVTLVGVASASGLGASHAAGRYGFQYATSDADQIVQDPQINAVAVLTRHNLHASQTLAALAAGKHVFCEKPLALTPEELDQIEGALGVASPDIDQPGPAEPNQQSKIPNHPYLMVGFNRRFAPLALRLAEFVAGVGEPLVAHYRVNAGYLPPDHWLHDPAQGGGRLVGEACHFVDFLTYLTGRPPAAVTAHALPDSGRYRQDNVVLTLAFPDDALGTVTYVANGDKTFPKERVEVFCGGRVAVLDNFRSLELVREGRREVHRSRLRQDKGHRQAWQAFTQAILTGGAPPIPYSHMVGVTRATFGALESLRTGETIRLF
jgi:predicted dehydrogenase